MFIVSCLDFEYVRKLFKCDKSIYDFTTLIQQQKIMS